MCKKSIKNSQPFVRKMRNVRTPWGGRFFLTHTVYAIFRSKKYRVASQLLGDKPTARHSTGRHVSINWQFRQLFLLVFCLCFILVNLCWSFMFVVLWQTSMNALIITETATHRRIAPTRLEALPVPVLTDILATGSPVQVTNNEWTIVLYFTLLRKF